MTATMPTTTLTTHLPVPWLAAHGVKRGDWRNSLSLGDVRDALAQQVREQEYEDQQYTLGHYHVRTGDLATTRTTVQRLTRQGLQGPAMPLTKHGLAQLAREVLPSRGLGFVESLALLDVPNGRKLADLNWAMFMRAADKPRMVRTAMYRDPADGQLHRTIRSVVSQSYARVDDLELLDLLLDLPDTRDMAVISFDRTDTMLRLRLALDPMQGEPELRKPIPIVDVTNSEVGNRSVTMRGGIWRLICTNGMASLEPGATWRWTHSGDPRRIVQGVPSALEDMRTAISPALQAYDAALHTAIDDAVAWMEASLSDHLTQPQLQASAAALLDDTTTPGMGLASVVDAITLAAQEQDSLEAREAMELAGAQALRIGLRDARDGRLLAPRQD